MSKIDPSTARAASSSGLMNDVHSQLVVVLIIIVIVGGLEEETKEKREGEGPRLVCFFSRRGNGVLNEPWLRHNSSSEYLLRIQADRRGNGVLNEPLLRHKSSEYLLRM